MRINIFILILILLSVSTIAVDFRPQGNIIGKNVFSILDFVDINSTRFYENGIRLLNSSLDTIGNKSCSDGQIVSYNATSTNWECSSAGSGTLTSVVDSGLYAIATTAGTVVTVSWNDTRGNLTYLTASSESDLNVNQSNYWDGLDTPNDFSTITATGLISGLLLSGSLNWTNLTSYPVACPTGTFVTAINDTITCTAPTAEDVDAGTYPSGNYVYTDNVTASYFLGDGSQLTGISSAGNCTTAGSCATIGYLDYQNTGNFNLTGDLSITNIITYFGTACTGTDFVQDVADDGTFTCTAAPSAAGASKWLDGGAWLLPNATFAVNINVSAINATTLDTGQGAYELYAMDQDVEQADGVTFATLDTGQGANELYDMDQNVLTSSLVKFVNVTVTDSFNLSSIILNDVDTTVADNDNAIITSGGVFDMLGDCGVGEIIQNVTAAGVECVSASSSFVYATYFDQNLNQSDAVTFATLDTGQGANELYDMDQNVLATSDVTFNNITVSNSIILNSITVDDIDTTVADNDRALISSGGVFDMLGDCGVGEIIQNVTAAGVECVDDATGSFVYATYFDQNLNQSDAVTFATVDTGQGANDLYDMDQNVLTSSFVTFEELTIQNGTRALTIKQDDTAGGDGTRYNTNEYHRFSNDATTKFLIQDSYVQSAVGFHSTSYLNGTTVDTGQGATEVYAMDQDVEQADGVTFATVDTGQGANELYDMDQNVLEASEVTFAQVNVTPSSMQAAKFIINSSANMCLFQNGTNMVIAVNLSGVTC